MRLLSVTCFGWLLLLFVQTALADDSVSNCSASAKIPCHHRSLKTITPTREPSYQRLISVTLYPGSLRDNVVRIGHETGWNTVVWNAPEDYKWIGQTRISGPSIQAILGKLLVNYPLQAQFYNGNHVLAIVPRNLP